VNTVENLIERKMVRITSGSIADYIVKRVSREEGGMAITAMNQQNTDYFIMGPVLKPGAGVIEAIYSLFYLPANYKLILPAALSNYDAYYNQIVALVKKNSLEERVYFSKESTPIKSAEGFASAVLDTARASYCM